MKAKELTKFELKYRLQSLYCVIDDVLGWGIKFKSFEEVIEKTCSLALVEPSDFGCASFAEVAEILLAEYPHLKEIKYPKMHVKKSGNSEGK
jgi:hypothetical protein